jgi:type I restriction enzyme M protein
VIAVEKADKLAQSAKQDRDRQRGAEDSMTDEQKKKLEQKLWDIANTLRGKMGADEFRDYILGFIFYKYLSERMHSYATSLLADEGIDFAAINETSAEGIEILSAVKDASVEALGYFLKPSELFTAIAKRGEDGAFILGELTTILSNIERSTMGTDSEDDFDHLFEDLDLTSTKLGRSEEAKNALIAKVLTHLDAIDFRLDEAKADVLGDAYEYLIGQFASGAGKKAGEFYTPQQVSTILARIVTTGKTRLKTVYDPTCGSGSLLLRVAREVTDVEDFFGQEMNRTTYNLARMNMILHGVHYRNFDLKQEDTLEHPQHEGRRFEAIVANPPFSAKWSARPLFLRNMASSRPPLKPITRLSPICCRISMTTARWPSCCRMARCSVAGPKARSANSSSRRKTGSTR